MSTSHPFGTQITVEHLRLRFAALTQWEDRYRQLIWLARELPTLSAAEKLPQIEISGCENRVWLGHTLRDDGTLHFYGDSEGRIVRGLLAILLTAVEGKTAEQLLKENTQHLFHELGIEQQLTASRAQGLSKLFDKINYIARCYR